MSMRSEPQMLLKVACWVSPLNGVKPYCGKVREAKSEIQARAKTEENARTAVQHTQSSPVVVQGLTAISYTRIPNVHQSTADDCPDPLMTSGAMYSSVPTKLLVSITM